MLAPDFYVHLKDRMLTRQQFIDRISSYPPGVTLTRYDASVLTVPGLPVRDKGWKESRTTPDRVFMVRVKAEREKGNANENRSSSVG
jgi:hypothetical protein